VDLLVADMDLEYIGSSVEQDGEELIQTLQLVSQEEPSSETLKQIEAVQH